MLAAGLAVELRLSADSGRSAAAFAPDIQRMGRGAVQFRLPTLYMRQLVDAYPTVNRPFYEGNMGELVT